MAVGYELKYKIRNQNWENPYRTLQVHASRDEIARFATEGYLVRESLFSPQETQGLRVALDELADASGWRGAVDQRNDRHILD